MIKKNAFKGNTLKKIIEILIRVSQWMACISVIGVISLTGLEIISRWIFNFSTRASEELTGYMLVAVTYLGLSYTLIENGHLSVDIIFEKLSKRWKRIVSIINGFISTIFCLLLTFFSVKLVIQTIQHKSRSASTLNFPLIIPTIFIPIGTVIIALVILERTIGLIINKNDYSIESKIKSTSVNKEGI